MDFLKLFLPFDRETALPWNIRLIALFMALVVFLQIFAYGIYLPMNVYYAVLICLGFLSLPFGIHEAKANGAMFAFWGVMWLSILVNYDDIRPEYRSISRTIAFGLVLVASGPFFQSLRMLNFRRRLLQWLSWGLWAMTMLSFIGYVLHFLPMDRGGFYLGCTVHSMILGAVAGETGLNCLHEALRPRNSSKRRNLFLLMFVASGIVTVLAASRAALGSLGCASLVYFAFLFRGKMTQGIKNLLVIAICGMILLQFTGNVSSALNSKMGGTGTEKTAYTYEKLIASRQTLWHDRWVEICHSPIFGVGAYSIRDDLVDYTVSASGTIEPGSGWLFVFSSMGVFAFGLMVFLVFHPICRFWKNGRPGSDANLLLAQLVFWAVYMNAEAFITAAGSFNFFSCWLIIGISSYTQLSELNQENLSLLPKLQLR